MRMSDNRPTLRGVLVALVYCAAFILILRGLAACGISLMDR